MNRVSRPVVSWILRSRLHRLLSGHVMLVTYDGRRSGRRVTVPVQYDRHDGLVEVMVGGPERKQWWRNFETGHEATLLVQGNELTATGQVKGDGERVTVMFTPA